MLPTVPEWPPDEPRRDEPPDELGREEFPVIPFTTLAYYVANDTGHPSRNTARAEELPEELDGLLDELLDGPDGFLLRIDRAADRRPDR